MKNWPEKGHADFEELIGPVVKIIRDAISDGKIGNMYAAREYEGYETGEFTRAQSSDPAWHFSREGMAYHREHDRDIIDVAAMVLFQLGVEQGRRICTERNHNSIKIEGWLEGHKIGQAQILEAKKRKKG